VNDYPYDKAWPDIVFDGPNLKFVDDWSNLDAVDTWTPFTGRLDVTGKGGQIGTFRLFAALDKTWASYFFFDSVSLTVTACGP
jgi:hypothetical protein